jgi:hypothetical protein
MGALQYGFNKAGEGMVNWGMSVLSPRYGNFGGAGWTGGNEYPHKGPVDSMDQAFKQHDDYYDKIKKCKEIWYC